MHCPSTKTGPSKLVVPDEGAGRLGGLGRRVYLFRRGLAPSDLRRRIISACWAARGRVGSTTCSLCRTPSSTAGAMREPGVSPPPASPGERSSALGCEEVVLPETVPRCAQASGPLAVRPWVGRASIRGGRMAPGHLRGLGPRSGGRHDDHGGGCAPQRESSGALGSLGGGPLCGLCRDTHVFVLPDCSVVGPPQPPFVVGSPHGRSIGDPRQWLASWQRETHLESSYRVMHKIWLLVAVFATVGGLHQLDLGALSSMFFCHGGCSLSPARAEVPALLVGTTRSSSLAPRSRTLVSPRCSDHGSLAEQKRRPTFSPDGRACASCAAPRRQCVGRALRRCGRGGW